MSQKPVVPNCQSTRAASRVSNLGGTSKRYHLLFTPFNPTRLPRGSGVAVVLAAVCPTLPPQFFWSSFLGIIGRFRPREEKIGGWRRVCRAGRAVDNAKTLGKGICKMDLSRVKSKGASITPNRRLRTKSFI
jgi:hypothetical protein